MKKNNETKQITYLEQRIYFLIKLIQYYTPYFLIYNLISSTSLLLVFSFDSNIILVGIGKNNKFQIKFLFKIQH